MHFELEPLSAITFWFKLMLFKKKQKTLTFQPQLLVSLHIKLRSVILLI